MTEKVGLDVKELTPADFYPSADKPIEPISSVKQPGQTCDLCACNPCQCDKMVPGTAYEVRLWCSSSSTNVIAWCLQYYWCLTAGLALRLAANSKQRLVGLLLVNYC